MVDIDIIDTDDKLYIEPSFKLVNLIYKVESVCVCLCVCVCVCVCPE